MSVMHQLAMQQNSSLRMFRYFFTFLVSFLIIFGDVFSQDCGQMPSKRTEKEDWPWMAAIMKSDKVKESSLLCSGFLIDRRHVLSAAHCFQLSDGSEGAPIEDISVRINGNPEELYLLSAIAIHTGFQHLYHNDIALLTLSRDVDFLDFTPICLPPDNTTSRNLTGMTVTNLGYNAMRPGDGLMPFLETSNKSVISNYKCAEDFRKVKSSVEILGHIICTINGTPLCFGSSGGPLMLEDQGRWYAVGLLLMGYSCEANPYPEGYTRLSAYLDWIKENSN